MTRSSTGPSTAVRRLTALFVALALGAGLSALAAAEAYACAASPLGVGDFRNADGSCFEGGDGNLDRDVLTAGFADWAEVSDETIYIDPGASGGEGQFTQGSKELEPGGWTLTAAEPNDKSDITALARRTERVSGELFLHLAFTTQGNTGSMNASIELNRDPALWDNGNGDGAVMPTRSDGDVLITYDGNQQTSEERIGICRWRGNKYGQGAGGSGAYGWYRLDGTQLGGAVKDCTTVALAHAVAGFNDTAALDNAGHAKLPAPFDTAIAADRFGELSINLSAVLGDDEAEPCFDFGSLWVHTREGNSVFAAMEDYVRPRPLVDATNCGGTIDKKVAVGDIAGTYHDGTPADPSAARVGDTLFYAIAITNTGSLAFAPTVTDPMCDSVPLRVAPNDTDPTFDPGDSWHYACRRVLQASDSDPFTNTAVLRGQIGAYVIEAQDSTDTTRPLPPAPAITILKSGPATAVAGEIVSYSLEVTNSGPTSFDAGLVVVSDAQCQAPPALTSRNADTSPATLDPGDRWTYACQVATQPGQTEVVNVGAVRGTDQNGKVAESQSTATTVLSQPASGTSPVGPTSVVRAVAGARLSGTVACATARYARAAVTGSQISRVTFTLNGRRVSSLTKPNSGAAYVYRALTRSLGYGSYRLSARVEFTQASGATARTLRLGFSRCRPRAVRPVFTG